MTLSTGPKKKKVAEMKSDLFVGDVCIIYANKEYISASEALLAYIRAFDCKDNSKEISDQRVSVIQKYDRSITDLFLPKSVLHLTAQRSIDTGVHHTRDELRLYAQKHAINSSFEKVQDMDKMIKIADALNKSTEMLKQLSEDRVTALDNISDTTSDPGSLATESLIAYDPTAYDRYSIRPRSPAHISTNGHVYSYRTDRARSSSRKRFPDYKESEIEAARRSKSMPPNIDISGVRRPRLNSNEMLVSSRPPRSRTMFTDTNTMPRMGLGKSYTQAPHLGDGGRPPPRWVQDMATSDITSVASFPETWELKNKRASETVGLKLADLDAVIDKHTDTTKQKSLRASRKDLFTMEMKRNLRNVLNPETDVDLPDKPDATTSSMKPTRSQHLRTTLSNLKNDTVHSRLQSAKLNSKDKIDTMLREVELLRNDLAASPTRVSPTRSSPTRALHSTAIEPCSPVREVRNGTPRCPSSIDGLSSIDRPLIGPGGDMMYNPFTSPLRTPISPSRSTAVSPKLSTPTTSHLEHLLRSPGTDVNMDGDRPWENPPVKFKSPKRINEPKKSGVIQEFLHDCLNPEGQQPARPTTPTLTGREQPGTLEALKNMLYKLQSEIPCSPGNVTSPDMSSQGDNALAHTLSGLNDERLDQLKTDVSALDGYNFQHEPGGQSLERALVHLSRLKELFRVNDATNTDKVS